MERAPHQPRPQVEKAPRTERVQAALERVRELAQGVTGQSIGWLVDTFANNSRGYGVEHFHTSIESAQAEAQAVGYVEPRFTEVFDDMPYGNNSRDPHREERTVCFHGTEICSMQHTSPVNGSASEHYLLFGEEVTLAEFEDFTGALHRTLVDAIAAEHPELPYRGDRRMTYTQKKAIDDNKFTR